MSISYMASVELAVKTLFFKDPLKYMHMIDMDDKKQ